MSQLEIPKVERIEARDNYGKFSAEPLPKGFGVTLGNALRRVLLSSLPGAAIIRVRIEGIQHEFSPIPQVKEDTLDFLLNIKAIRIKSLTGSPGKMVLRVERAGKVYAADIEPSADFEIVNPEHYLATLDSPEARLYVEFDVELGEGYREAESGENVTPGVIAVDAVFTPVRKVNYTVEPIYVGRESSHEKLFLEIWTDGSITPDEALSRSAGTLATEIDPFVNLSVVTQLAEEKQAVYLIPEEKFNMPVEQMDLSVRTINCLRRGGITTVGELIGKTEKELMSLRNFGQKSKQELEERLQALGLSLSASAEEKPEETQAESLAETAKD